MSDKERKLLQRFAQFPGAVKEKLLDHLEGAAMAMDAMGLKEKEGMKDEGDRAGTE